MWFKRIFKAFSNSDTSQTKKGKVKFFNRKRGYGFIEAESLDHDVFVHVTSIDNHLNKGDKVAFEIEKSDKGLEAKNVQVLTV